MTASMDLLTGDDTCVATVGLGMISKWNLTGQLQYFDAGLTMNTDGYMITASL